MGKIKKVVDTQNDRKKMIDYEKDLGDVPEIMKFFGPARFPGNTKS